MNRQRKASTRLLVMILNGLVVILTQGCAIASPDISGRVIDADTGKPVSGAYVYARSGYYKCGPFELGGCGCVTVDARLTRTNTAGGYRFDRPFDFGPFYNDRFGTVAVYKQDYISLESNINYSKYEHSRGIPGNLNDLYHRYFFGTGRYSDDYQAFPLHAKSIPYELAASHIKTIGKLPRITPRLLYLINVINSPGGPACIDYGTDNAEQTATRFADIILKEAVAVATTAEDEKLLKQSFNKNALSGARGH